MNEKSTIAKRQRHKKKKYEKLKKCYKILFTVINLVVVFICVISVFIITGKPDNKQQTANIYYLAESYDDGYVTTQADRYFAELVSTKTEGRIQIEVCANGVYGEETDVIKKIMEGKIAFARVSPEAMAERIDSFNSLLLPYLFKNDEQMWNYLEGIGGAKLENDMKKIDIIGLSWFYSGSRSFFLTGSINSLTELSNLKIRVENSSVMFAMCETLHCIPKYIEKDTVEDEILAGKVDGSENNLIGYFTNGLYKVCPYYLQDEHSRIPDVLIASEHILNDMSKEDVEIIKKCAVAAQNYERRNWFAMESAVKDRLISEGVTFVEISEGERYLMKAQFSRLYKEFGDITVKNY